ncbi:Fibronectin type III domain [uncultured Eubacterium sp.]|nr:Fibronectin type III domain [uncultured Eubacterium sp.]
MKKKSRIAIILTMAVIISILPVNSMTALGYTQKTDAPSYFFATMEYGYIDMIWDDPDEDELNDLSYFEVYVKEPGSNSYKLIEKIDALDMDVWTSDDMDDAYYNYTYYADTPGSYSFKLRTVYSVFDEDEGKDIEKEAEWLYDEEDFASLEMAKVKTELVGKTSVKVTWNKIDGADGYHVYGMRADYSYDAYDEIISSGDTTSWICTGLKENKEYIFAVAPYVLVEGKPVESMRSDWMNCTTGVTKAKITSIYTSAGSAVLKWSKNANADGYEIFRAASAAGTYKKIKTIKNKTTTSFTDKKKKAGKRYYYKVRAYVTLDGSKHYGAFSASKSVKISSKTLTQQQARKAYLALKNESLYYPKTLIVNGIFSGTIKGEKAIMIYYSAKNGYGVRSWDYFTYFPSSGKWNHSYTPVALKNKTTLNKSKIIHWN